MTSQPLDYYKHGRTGLLAMNKEHTTLYPPLHIERLKRENRFLKIALLIASSVIAIQAAAALGFLVRIF